MGFVEILLIAVGLAMDAFAVSLAAGALKEARDGRATFRVSFHFGLFQFIMPVIGWYAGSKFVSYIYTLDHWIAFGLLAYVGGRMLLSGLGRGEQAFRGDPSRGYLLMTLSVATSIDALAVGLSLAMIKVSIWYPSVVIGFVAAGFSIIGISLGKRLGTAFGKRMEVAGGIILILIGLRILYAHLAGGA